MIAEIQGGGGGAANTAGRRVVVCAGTGCVASGAYDVFKAFAEQLRTAGTSFLEIGLPLLGVGQSQCGDKDGFFVDDHDVSP